MGLSPFPGLQALGLLSMVTLMTGFVSDATVTSTLMRSTFDWRRAIAAARPAAGGPAAAGVGTVPDAR
jgi:hypothetical protein